MQILPKNCKVIISVVIPVTANTSHVILGNAAVFLGNVNMFVWSEGII